ncbi:hypothetical protein A2U01_0034469, partial [Trifolium medium]|nr:hypothetical protein [Trifolium medium]
FKEKFYGVRPITGNGWKTIVTRGPRKDEDGNVVKGLDGVPYEEDYANFHFHWNKGHYEISTEFTYKRGELFSEEVEDFDRLVAFVESFPANLLEDSEGNPLLDSEGRQRTSAKLVDTKRLLGCKTQEDVEAFFLEMTSATARLRQAKNTKKKAVAALGASGSAPSGTPTGQVSPAPSVEIVEKRGRDGDLEDVISRKNPRFDAVSGSTFGPHRLTPG